MHFAREVHRPEPIGATGIVVSAKITRSSPFQSTEFLAPLGPLRDAMTATTAPKTLPPASKTGYMGAM